MEQYLECAKIVGTHGVRGMVRVACYCNTPEALARLKRIYIKKGNDYREMRVLRGSVQKTMVLFALEGISTLEQAIPLKETILYADRADFHLRRGEIFIADLLGLPVLDDKTGEKYGTLEEITTSGVQELYVVRAEDGTSFMIPGVPAFIKRRITEGTDAGVYVELIEGMREI